MTKRKCGCEYATAKNTSAVRHGYEMGGYLLHACEQHMTTQPAPLLTAEDAASLLDWTSADNEMHAKFQAIADGRTACVRVMSEDECRAAFERDDNRPGHYYTERGKDGYYIHHSTGLKWLGWLACARAMGAVR